LANVANIDVSADPGGSVKVDSPFAVGHGPSIQGINPRRCP